MSTRVVLLLAFAVLAAAAQTNAPRAHMVTLNIVAFDSHGQPVGDLTSDDFQIQDQGKKQQIAFFRRNEGRPRQTETLGPHEFSNRSGAGIHDATVILLDLLNANLSDRGTGWEGVNHALEHLENADNLYLYLLTADAKLYPVYGLPGTEGAAPVPENPQPGKLWTSDIRTRLESAIRTVNKLKSVDERDPMIRVRQTYHALAQLGSQVEAVPGRKNVIWISHGIPLFFRTITSDYVDMTQPLRQFCAKLNHAGIAMYTVDQGGPGSTPPGGSNGSEGPGYQSQDTLQQLAELTGGHAYPGNNVESAVAAAIASTRGSYLILYNPPAENWDGKFHKIRVTCTRKGIHLQSQQGYLASPPPPVDDAMRESFEAASANEFDVSGISLRATVTPVPNSPDKFDYEVRINPDDLLLIHQGNNDTGELAVGFMGLVGALMKPAKPVVMHVALTPEQRAAGAKGVPLARQTVDARGIDKVRVVVLDMNSGEVGTLTVPVKANTKAVTPQP